MRIDGEAAFFAGLFALCAVIAICLTVAYTIRTDANIQFATIGLQECQSYGNQGTVWSKECK